MPPLTLDSDGRIVCHRCARATDDDQVIIATLEDEWTDGLERDEIGQPFCQPCALRLALST